MLFCNGARSERCESNVIQQKCEVHDGCSAQTHNEGALPWIVTVTINHIVTSFVTRVVAIADCTRTGVLTVFRRTQLMSKDLSLSYAAHHNGVTSPERMEVTSWIKGNQKVS